jgi:hypothetical protein
VRFQRICLDSRTAFNFNPIGPDHRVDPCSVFDAVDSVLETGTFAAPHRLVSFSDRSSV